MQTHRGESRLPASIATLVAVGLYTALPSDVMLGPRYVIPVLELALLIAVVIENPVRMTKQTRRSRALALGLMYLIMATNAVSLVLLIIKLVSSHTHGVSLLVAALQVWLTNVIVFALAYWELDRGGPVERHHVQRLRFPTADFRFPQDEDHDTVVEVARGSSKTSGWVADYVDYLYVSLTNSSAFSPTDTMPLSSRAKILMGLQSTMALVVSVVVIARGVGSLT